MEEIIVRSGDDLKELQGRLDDLRPALKGIGVLLESAAQKAFLDQKLGDEEWEGRYPGQEDPFINLAGSVADFNDGKTRPLARRFQRRPVLRDTGNLMGSIASRIRGKTKVETGSAVSYAAAHQWGGWSTQAITSGAKKRMEKWWQTKQGKPYALKMMGLLGMEQLETEVNARPFLGITTETEEDIAAALEIYLAKGES